MRDQNAQFPALVHAGRCARRPGAARSARRTNPPCGRNTELCRCRRGVPVAVDTRVPFLFLAFRREATGARETLSAARDAAGRLAAARRRPRRGLLRRHAGHGTRGLPRQAARCAPEVVVFYEDNYNFLSKMCLGRMREACCEMIASARARAAPASSPRAPMPRMRPTAISRPAPTPCCSARGLRR